MSLPTGPVPIPHDPEDTPVVDIDPHSARPFSFGDISSGTATIRAAFPAFEDPVDIYLAILAEPYGLFLISPYELFELTDIALAVAWRSAQINALEETIDTIPITDLAPGTYWGYTVVVPAGTDPATFDFESSAYYMWYFAVTLP